jgi:hypothetical protein
MNMHMDSPLALAGSGMLGFHLDSNTHAEQNPKPTLRLLRVYGNIPFYRDGARECWHLNARVSALPLPE